MHKIFNKDSQLFTTEFFDLLYSDDDFDDNKISCYLTKDKLKGVPQDLFLLWDGYELGNCQNTGFNLEANFYTKHPIYVSQVQMSNKCQGGAFVPNDENSGEAENTDCRRKFLNTYSRVPNITGVRNKSVGGNFLCKLIKRVFKREV